MTCSWKLRFSATDRGEIDFAIVALGRKQPAMAVSLLNFEPKVSKFPVI